MAATSPNPNASSSPGEELDVFHSTIIDQLRRDDPPGVWSFPGGEIRLPRVFGFCRGVKRALAMAAHAASVHHREAQNGKLVLLGEIIHNPWVNDHFRGRDVTILTGPQRDELEKHISANDCAIIPAFGVPLDIETRLREVGCQVVDCSCGDVIRLWRWSTQAVADGFGVVIFGRARHDETVVTKSRLAAAGGHYIVIETVEQAQQLASDPTEETFRSLFGPDATNAASLDAFGRIAMVSQTTMLYGETQAVRELVREAFEKRFGPLGADDRLRFQPAVCRATQSRQDAAIELCQAGCDLVVVVGGFTSSNTRHLHTLASQYAPAYLIESAEAIRSPHELHAADIPPKTTPRGDLHETIVTDWLPQKRPLTVGILAGASSPEIVIGEVLSRLAEFLQK